MQTGVAAVRASYLRRVLVRCDEIGGEAALLRARLPDAELTAIECSGALAWLPIGVDVELQRVIAAELGPERARELQLASVRQLWAGSLGHPAVQSAIGAVGRAWGSVRERIIGGAAGLANEPIQLDPGVLARMLPKAWALLYRGCGRWSITRTEPSGVELVLVEAPARCRDEPAWLASVETMLHALLILGDACGQVERLADERRELNFRMRWS